MKTLKFLKKMSCLAVSRYDLVRIAAYSSSPNMAYVAAKKLQWSIRYAKSCRFLAIVIRDYGFDLFLKVVDCLWDIDEFCFCECHVGNYDLSAFFREDVRMEMTCGCCDVVECFHASHYEEGWECPLCNFSYDEDECDEDEQNQNQEIEECDSSYDSENEYSTEDTADAEDTEDTADTENTADTEDTEDTADTEDTENTVDTEDTADIYQAIYQYLEQPSPESINERMERIAREIQTITGTSYSVEIVETCIKNAYADGSKVVVTSGLTEVFDDDELAFVVAHEIVHNIEEHPIKHGAMFSNVKEDIAESIHGTGGFIKKTIRTLAVGVIGILSFQSQRRNDEVTADMVAQRLVKKAGFSGAKAASAMRKLGHSERSILSSHPGSMERIAYLEKNK